MSEIFKKTWSSLCLFFIHSINVEKIKKMLFVSKTNNFNVPSYQDLELMIITFTHLVILLEMTLR